MGRNSLHQCCNQPAHKQGRYAHGDGKDSSLCCRYARVDFTWGASGSISVVTHFQAVPDVTLGSTSNKSDRTILAAFILLVLLTAAQGGVVGVAVWGRVQKATSIWKIVLVRLSSRQYIVPLLVS